VRAHQDVDLSPPCRRQNFLLFPDGHESMQRADAHGPVGNRSDKVRSACDARMVVGASTAICFLSQIALKAARMATSVLPKPTSPHTSRSIGFPDSMSRFHVGDGPGLIPAVRTYSKAARNSFCKSPSGLNANPSTTSAGIQIDQSLTSVTMALRVFSLAPPTTCLRVWTARECGPLRRRIFQLARSDTGKVSLSVPCTQQNAITTLPPAFKQAQATKRPMP